MSGERLISLIAFPLLIDRDSNGVVGLFASRAEDSLDEGESFCRMKNSKSPSCSDQQKHLN